MAKAKGVVGAHVQFCGHAGWFVADIWPIGNAWVVHAGGPVDPGNINRFQMYTITHHLVDFPGPCFWKPKIGVFVVPAANLRVVNTEEKDLEGLLDAHKK